MAGFSPTQEGINNLVQLLTDVHKPGANQGEARLLPWGESRGGAGMKDCSKEFLATCIGVVGCDCRCQGAALKVLPMSGRAAARRAAARPIARWLGAALASTPTRSTHPLLDLHQVYSQLDRCKAVPDFNNYLAFIFASGEGLPIEVRGRRGGVDVGGATSTGRAAGPAWESPLPIERRLPGMHGASSSRLRHTPLPCPCVLPLLRRRSGKPRACC